MEMFFWHFKILFRFPKLDFHPSWSSLSFWRTCPDQQHETEFGCRGGDRYSCFCDGHLYLWHACEFGTVPLFDGKVESQVLSIWNKSIQFHSNERS